MKRMCLMERVCRKLPGNIPPEAIVDVHYEGREYGYWVTLADGYTSPATECHTIHEYTLESLFYEVSCVMEEEEEGDVEDIDFSDLYDLINS